MSARRVLRRCPGSPWRARPVELGQRAGRLDARRPAADDDDVERAVVDQLGVLVGRLPRPRTWSLSRTASGSVYIGKRVLGGALGAEEVDLRAEPEDEVVVRRAARGPSKLTSRASRSIAGHRGLVHRRVLLAVQQVTQRVADRRRLEQAGRELVEERLEGVVVVPVDEHDVGVRVLELLRRADAGEAAAENENALPFVGAHLQPALTLRPEGRRRIAQSGRFGERAMRPV